ncbi:hypothetical protein HDU99_000888 [Rhizoclosmatium hyalinum]|nr:hypothetical protein HDU99_000888 [Rhizoclosmatium hyalinum]
MGALPAGMANWNKITTAQIDGNCFTGTSPNTLIPLGTQRTGCTAPTAGGLGPGGANAPQLPVKTTASRPPAPPGATADPNSPAATQDANAPDPNASSTDGTDPSQPLATAPIVSGIAPPTGKVVQQNSGAVPPPTSTSTSTSSTSPSFTSNVPLIAGVAGGAAALLLIIGSVIFFVRRKSQDRRNGDLDMYADDDGYYRRGDDNEAGRYNEKARMNGVSSRNGGGRPEKANESREKASPSPRYGDKRDNNGDRRDGDRREDRGRRDNNDFYEMAEKKRGAAGAANTARSPATRDRDRERDIRSPSNKDMRSPARQPDVSASKKKGPTSRDDSRSRPRDLSPDSRGGSFDSDDSYDDRRRGGNTNHNKGRDQSRSRRDDRDYDRRGDAASGGRRNDDRRNKY